MKKFFSTIKSITLLIGCVCILIAIFSNEPTIDRIILGILGASLCIIATFSTVRWALAALLSGCIAIVGIPNIWADGTFSWSSLLFVLIFVWIFIVSLRKAIKRFLYWIINGADLSQIDSMTGLQFEEYTAELLKKLGYTNVQVTKASGDQGIDVLATKDGHRYAIQCKHYSSKLDNTPVQEVYAGKDYYECDIGVVITNNFFTKGACELANALGVILWDRNTLKKMITEACPNYTVETEFAQDPIVPVQEEWDEDNTTHTSHTSIIKEASTTEDLIRIFSGSFDDYMVPQAVDAILRDSHAAVSTLQRRLGLGYERAVRIIDELEEKEVIGPFCGSQPREILITKEQWEQVRSCVSFDYPL